MGRHKRILAILLAVVMLPAAAFINVQTVQADPLAMASGYNSDVYRLSYVTEVEDQSQSNYCWAYMANAVLESFLLKTGRLSQVDLSETDMIGKLNGGTYGFTDLLQGGSYHQSVGYWTRGVQYGPCQGSDGRDLGYYVSGTADLGTYQIGDAQAKERYIQEMKNLIVQYGAVGVSVYFDAATRMQTTKNGAYYYPQESTPAVDHGVTVVGWNDNFPASSFDNTYTRPNRPKADGAFLVKNSWGRNDGSSINGNTGYYWISYENYFQDAFAVTQVTERSGLYDRIYETDYHGLYGYTAGTSYSRTYQLGTGTERLTAFSTYVREGASYRFFVNGQELTQFGGIMAQSGYRVFRLTEPMILIGTSLELRVDVDSRVDAVPTACSASSRVPDTGNVCLKAFTTGSPAIQYPGSPTGTVSGVTVYPQTCIVARGGQQAFSVNVTGNGPVSQLVDWRLDGNSSSSTRIVNGVLYVGADESSSVLFIQAVSNADRTKGGSAQVTIQGRQDTSIFNTYTVTFVSDGQICKTQSVPYGGSATAPAVAKEGYSLQWDSPYNYITGNLVVNAVWTKIEPIGDDDSLDTPDDTNINGSGNEPVEDGDGVVQVLTIDQGIYTCWRSGTAQYTRCTGKNRINIKIPASIRAGGRKYKVVSLGEQCAQRQKKVRTAIIGKNVASIGDGAFQGCKQLVRIKIRSEDLEYIGSDAFQGISQNAAIYVPRSRLAEYRSMIRASGNTKVRVKAYE